MTKTLRVDKAGHEVTVRAIPTGKARTYTVVVEHHSAERGLTETFANVRFDIGYAYDRRWRFVTDGHGSGNSSTLADAMWRIGRLFIASHLLQKK